MEQKKKKGLRIRSCLTGAIRNSSSNPAVCYESNARLTNAFIFVGRGLFCRVPESRNAERNHG